MILFKCKQFLVVLFLYYMPKNLNNILNIFFISLILLGVCFVSCNPPINPITPHSVAAKNPDAAAKNLSDFYTSFNNFKDRFDKMSKNGIKLEKKFYDANKKYIGEIEKLCTQVVKADHEHFKSVNNLIGYIENNLKVHENLFEYLSEYREVCNTLQPIYQEIWSKQEYLDFIKSADLSFLLKTERVFFVKQQKIHIALKKDAIAKNYSWVNNKNLAENCLVSLFHNITMKYAVDFPTSNMHNNEEIVNYISKNNNVIALVFNSMFQDYDKIGFMESAYVTLRFLVANDLHNQITTFFKNLKKHVAANTILQFEKRKKNIDFSLNFKLAVRKGHLNCLQALAVGFDVNPCIIQVDMGMSHDNMVKVGKMPLWLYCMHPECVCSDNLEKSKQFIKYFKNSYLKSVNTGRNSNDLTAKWLNTTVDHMGRNALAIACERGNIELVKWLVSLGADINHLLETDYNRIKDTFTTILDSNPQAPIKSSKILMTPYAYARNNLFNITHIATLIKKYGADPLMLRYKNFDENGMEIQFSSGFFADYINHPNEKAFRDNLTEILVYEEIYILENTLKYMEEKLANNANNDDKKIPREIADSETIHPSIMADISSQKTSSEKKDTPIDLKIIKSAYIACKKEQIKVAKKRDKNSFTEYFDLLVFEYLTEESDTEKSSKGERIRNFILKNPEMEFLSIQALLRAQLQNNENIEQSIRQDILEYLPRTLHRYCELQSKIITERQAVLETRRKQEEVIPNTDDNLYKINSSTLTCRAYIYLTSSIKEKVSDNYHKKLTALLVKGTKFIKANSKDQSGIKTHAGITKVKLAQQDTEIILEPYKDKFGNILFVAKDVVDHKELGQHLQKYAYIIQNTERSIPEIIASLS